MNNYTDLCETFDQANLNSWIENEEAPDFVQELRECGEYIISECPNIDQTQWIDTLLRQYPCEVVDAFGVDSGEVSDQLAKLWLDISK